MTQIFVSHSSSDKKVLGFFSTIFASTNVRAVFKEIEGFASNSLYVDIMNYIRISSAVFILLGKNAQKLKHTRDWIAWESGISKTLEKEIWVFEPIHLLGKINVVIPDLSHYVIYWDSKELTHYIRNIIDSYDESKKLSSSVLGGAAGLLGGLILESLVSDNNKISGIGGTIGSIIGAGIGLVFGDKSHTRPLGITLRCVKCRNSYEIHNKLDVIRCPVCNTVLKISWEKINTENTMQLIKEVPIPILPKIPEHPIQIEFNRLKKLIEIIFISKGNSSRSFALVAKRSDKWEDYFGFYVENKEPLDDQKHYFLDGNYYIIPNSATLRLVNNIGKEETIITKNDLPKEMSANIPEIFMSKLNTFFDKIKSYVKTEHNIIIT